MWHKLSLLSKTMVLTVPVMLTGSVGKAFYELSALGTPTLPSVFCATVFVGLAVLGYFNVKWDIQRHDEEASEADSTRESAHGVEEQAAGN